ncbi:MAG: methyltransferase domain-containing protein [Patescibacteria group bacterium]
MLYDYEEFYRKYPVNQHDVPERHIATAALLKGRVLDIGCGTGTLSDYFFGPYVGVDISNQGIKMAKEVRRKDAEFVVGDCTNPSFLHFADYDTIVMCEFLEHIEDDSLIFSQIKAQAQKGTRLVISVPNGNRIPCDEHVRTFTVPQLRTKLSPLGRVKFHNWAGFKGQILCTVDIGEENIPLLSLCMILKNEELGLERAVLSAIDYVDNIVLAVDNSSNDKTLEIAKMYADTLKTFDWSDDFAKARNFAHAGIKTDWILFLDGHEYIDKCEKLDEFLKNKAEGLLCTVELENHFQFRNPRIYRNGCQFEGRVHEKQNCKDVVFFPGFLVKHGRLGGQSAESSAARECQTRDMVPRIMGEEIRKNKKNIRASFHLGLHAQSRKRFSEAIKWYNLYLKYSPVKSERWFVFFNRSLCYFALGKNFRAFWSVFRADNEVPGRWEISKLKGLIYYSSKKYGPAIESFVDSFKINTGDQTYKPWPRDDSATWNLIAESFFHLGQYDKAHIAFEKVKAIASNDMLKDIAGKRAALMFEMAKTQR